MKKCLHLALLVTGILSFLTFTNTIYAANSGWDYNLTKRCAKSPYPDKPNYYQDTTQCDTSNKNYTIAVQSEKELGISCSGVANQSLPINQPGSPLSIDWIPHSDEFANQNWQVNLSTDFITKSNPCGANHFTWYTLMDHVAHNGGPFALPNNLSTSVSAKLSQDNPNGATRAFLGWQGYWDGKSHGIEINFFHTDNWGDADSQPDIITSIKNPTLEFISMDGRTLGLNLNLGETKMLYVKWVDIIQSLITRGYLTAPSGGWNNSTSTAVYIGTEVNNFTSTNAAKTILSITNFRNLDLEPILGDLNTDNKVDIFDYNLLVASFGNPYTIFDYNQLVANFGKTN